MITVALETPSGGNRTRQSGASRQKVMRFEQPNQFRGPFPSPRHLSGISERERLR
jgi:hypothetical protein